MISVDVKETKFVGVRVCPHMETKSGLSNGTACMNEAVVKARLTLCQGNTLPHPSQNGLNDCCYDDVTHQLICVGVCEQMCL